LSGGIKNNFEGAKSGANIMKSQIDDIINFKYNSYCSNNINSTDYTDSKQNNCERRKINTKNMFEWDYVLDEKSTNTVENFI
jgi:hypothetical protein